MPSMRKRPEEAPQPYGAFAAWYRSGLLSGAALLVLGALVAVTEPGHDSVYAAAPDIARMIGASLSKTRRALTLLQDRRAIAQTQRGSRYRVSGWKIIPPRLPLEPPA